MGSINVLTGIASTLTRIFFMLEKFRNERTGIEFYKGGLTASYEP